MSAPFPSYNKNRLLVAVCLGAFMATVDTSLISVGLPRISSALKTTLAEVSWVMVAYLLASASLQMVVGRLADMAAPRGLFIAGVLTFAGASGLAGVSPGFPFLLTCRLLQGVGAALMLGVGPKLISLAFGEGERGFALGMFSAGFATGVTLGAPLGGFLVSHFDWRALFGVNPLLGLVALGVGVGPLRAFGGRQAWDWRALDLPGGVILTAILALAILTLTGARDHGLWTPASLGGLVLVTLGLGVLLVTERRRSNPLLHREMWFSRDFFLGSLGVFLAFASVMGTFFLLPFFLVQTYGYSPTQVGLMLAVLSLSNALMSFLGGFLADRLGNLIILRTGLAFIVMGLLALGQTSPQTSAPALGVCLALTGMGLGLFSAPNLNEVLRGVQRRFMGLAAGTNAVLKNLGALVGVIVLIAALGSDSESAASLKAGVCYGPACFPRAFRWAAVLAAGNFLVNLYPRESS